MLVGLQRIHYSCYEFTPRAVSYSSDYTQGNWADGSNHSSQIQLDSNAAEAKHLRGSYDFAITFPRRQVKCFLVFHLKFDFAH